MLERYKNGVKVEYKVTDDIKTRNKIREKAIEQHFDENTRVSKKAFLKFYKGYDLQNNDNNVLNKIQGVDFAKANPRNNSFINELSFAGQSITEGFLECFKIERNRAIEKYKKQLQIIEKKDEGGGRKFFVGTFMDDKLKRLTPYKDSKVELEQRLNKEQNIIEKKRNEQQILQRRSLRKEEEGE